MSGDGLGAAVHRFTPGKREPDAIAKVSPRAGDELRALRTIAAAAAAAGARVPEVLAEGALGSVPVVLQSALPGRSAALLIRDGRLKAQAVQERLSAWLTRWASATMSRRALGPADFERFVFRPIAELAPLLPDNSSYREYLNGLCARAAAETCPLVPSHGDLTSANVLLDRSQLGIVDWENARDGSLPLFDFFYAVSDAVAAKDGYADRLGAFASCFTPAGPDTHFVAALRRRLADALSAGEATQELSFHACWLHHAANEARRAPAYAGPFLRILHTIAREPQRLAWPDEAR
jgi:aminoglycoside phosphotransferase (APT) family kinase protein